MSLRSISKYGHLVVVVHRCGFRITRILFFQKLEEISVDEFLYENKNQILKHAFAKKKEKILYPGCNKTTDVARWDLNTFCFFLVNFFALDDKVMQDIKCLRMLRNELAHIAESDIDMDETIYITKLERIEGIVVRCSTVIGKPEVAEELKRCIKEIDTIQAAEVEEAKAEMKRWLEDDETYQIFTKISNDIRELLEKLHHIQEIREKNPHDDPHISAQIAVQIQNPLKQIQQILDAVLEENDQRFSNVASTVEDIKGDIRHLGPEVEGTSSGSILFKFTCSSMSSLIYLMDYFSGKILKRRINAFVQAIRESCDDALEDLLTVQIFVPKENQLEIIKTLEESSSTDVYTPLVNKMKTSHKVFNDPLYGQIELHPLCVKVIDTPQFQRLRYIKQLDTCYFVYPGASHNRFEHSIGVCHLAGKLLRVLKERQPEIDITTKDILCVEIAALCHDLGQGPFSHVFEHKFLPAIDPDSTWKHERTSVEMFEYMLRDKGYKLEKLLRRGIPGFEDKDIQFIKEMIDVPKELNAEEWPFSGRSKNKSFLYEVVANHVNGIDVDRWDYIARDSYMLGMKAVFDHNRCIHHARVIKADGRRQICYRDKAAQDLYDMFYSRMALYRRAYQHKTHNIIGLMVRDALVAANMEIPFTDEKGKRLYISDTIKDMRAFTHLTDDILQQIQRSEDKKLEKSRTIINRIVDREFYKYGWIVKTEVQENLFNKINQRLEEPRDLSKIIEIDVVNLDYGCKDKDPITNVWFFKKGQEDKAIRISKEQVSFVLPDTFAEQYIRVYCSVTDSQLFEVIEKSFEEWCKENDVPQPKGSVTSSTDRH